VIRPEFLPRKLEPGVTVTALDVLERVAQLVEEEPARMDMSTWYGDYNNRLDFFCRDGHQYGEAPRCGTVGCIAGWSGYVLGLSGLESCAWTAEDRVPLKLGLTKSQVTELFHPSYLVTGAESRGRVGQENHTRLALEHLRWFMRRYEHQLRTTTVQVGK
jgi:hypothetical protein